jgi:hypothetical protein
MNDAKDDIAVVLREMAKWANEPGEWTVVSDYARENGIKLDE